MTVRNLNMLTRRDNLIDFLTPKPDVDLSADVLDEIRWEGGSNFDVMNPLFAMPAPVQDYVDPALSLERRLSLTALPVQRGLRVTFDPDSFSLVGSQVIWVRRVVRINGLDTVEPARYMLAPPQGVARPTYVISGTAPSLALNASLQLELPAAMTSVAISVTSGSNLGVSFDQNNEQQVAVGVPEQIIVGTVSTLFLRGIGGASVFDIVLSKAYG